MKLSQLFTKTRKDFPRDETAKSAQLLIRAGFIYKDAAGVYDLLPLGLRVVERIKQVIREEMNQLGGQELLMSSLQRKDLWQQTGRWDDKKVDIWFKSALRNGTEVGFGWSHEEPITAMMNEYVSSYRDLPINVYQFQTKLRNEIRAKSGILRTREFIMKDLYSYSRDEAEHQKIFDGIADSYKRIFERLGIGDRTYFTFASGGAFTKFSHEFQTLTDAGEDTIFFDPKKAIAVNEEVMGDEVLKQLGLAKTDLEKATAAEVGNIFSFGTTKAEELGLSFVDEAGQARYAVMGSYGIGVTRLVGVIAECCADARGLVWPDSVAPARVHLLRLGGDADVIKAADRLYEELMKNQVEVIYDDRDETAGIKFADADLIGCPQRLTISTKTLDQDSVELQPRTESTAKLLPLSQAVKLTS